MRFNILHFALAGGVVWGLAMFVATLIATATVYGNDFLEIFKFYPWYDISYVGAMIGLIWGFIDGFAGCALFAWVYNHLGHSKG